jgi:polysaccharide export outer membrane protein
MSDLRRWQSKWVSALLRLSFALLPLMLAGAAVAATADDYHLGAGDLLKISVSGYPELSTDVRVGRSGKISYPFVGELSVDGLSSLQLEVLLARRLSEGGYIRQAQVSVLVSDYQSQKAAVLGQVTKPGQYPLEVSHTVLELLADAGGVIPLVGADEATLLHRDGSRTSVDLDALFKGEPSQNLPVSAGDTIYVPRAPQFYVYGEVQKPGVYRLERNMTVAQAISASGGLTPRGSDRRLLVKRRASSGSIRQMRIAVAETLEADDVLIVEEALF